MDERARELTRTILTDFRRVGSVLADRTKREAEVTAAASAPGGGLAAAGLLVAAVGGALLLVTPAIPHRNRRLRGRMMATSTLYLLVGGGAACIGALALRDVLSRQARRASQDLSQTARVVKEQAREEMQ